MEFTLPSTTLFIWAGLFGAIVGSFLNVLIHRLPRGEEVVITPSHCPHCNTRLKPSQLVPILSYILQRGKCAACKTRIHPRYVIVEITAAITTILALAWAGPNLSLLLVLTYLYAAIAIFFIDLEHFIIPDQLSLGLIAIGLLSAWPSGTLLSHLVATIIGFSLFFGLNEIGKLIYKQDAFGMGDAKLVAAIGALWGIQTMVATVVFSFLIGGGIGILLLATKIKKRTDIIPFGPSIIIGSICAMIWGNALWTIYFG